MSDLLGNRVVQRINELVTLFRFIQLLVVMTAVCVGPAQAQSPTSTMSHEAKSGQQMQNPLYPKSHVLVTYNANQQLGVANNIKQDELMVAPVLPIELGSNIHFILNPMFTYNRNISGQQVTNQQQPLQFPSYFTVVLDKRWFVGVGPYIQTPASNANNGSKQTGVGVSAGATYAPDNWTIGGTLFNSWGVGNDLSGGSASILNLQPNISYTSDDAWNFNLSSQMNFNYTARNATNQLTLSGGKTVRVLDYHVSFQLGPTYMVTTTPTSAKGFGAYFGVSMKTVK
jgi:hypothetical protein